MDRKTASTRQKRLSGIIRNFMKISSVLVPLSVSICLCNVRTASISSSLNATNFTNDPKWKPIFIELEDEMPVENRRDSLAQFLCAANKNSVINIENDSTSNSESFFDGICISISKIDNCKKLSPLIKNETRFPELTQHLCGWDKTKGEVKVCCPLDSFDDNVIKMTDLSKHPNFNLMPHKECGVSATDDRIIGGQLADGRAFPWMVRIGVLTEGRPGYWCGGSIITEKYILTAAHCVATLSPNIVNELVVKLYTFKNNTKKEERKQYFDDDISITTLHVVSVSIHPDYQHAVGLFKHDIAILRLKDSLSAGSQSRTPICLPFLLEYNVKPLGSAFRNETFFWKNPMVAGWGKMAENESNNMASSEQRNLYFTRVPLRPLSLCQVLYWNSNVNMNQICAGGQIGKTSNNKDSSFGATCFGDSGGPLFDAVLTSKHGGGLKFVQLGLVSFGRSRCGKSPAVFTRVYSYLRWILDSIQP